MRTAEDSSGTVLHRLIQEQLRYGNPTDTATLLAIQQQALRGGGGCGGGGGGASPRSSLESLVRDGSHTPQMSTRQEPQGQEHQGDFQHPEAPLHLLYRLHGEELPSYEEAKAHSRYLASQRGHMELLQEVGPALGLKHEHVRSLSERLLQVSLARSVPTSGMALSPSHSYPQLSKDHAHNGAPHAASPSGPPPQYPNLVKPPGYMICHSQENGHCYKDPPTLFLTSRHRFSVAQSQVTCHNSESSHTTAGQEGFKAAGSQMEVLAQENERLKRELQAHGEKAIRLQKMEEEIWKISEAYEVLMKGSMKREALEKVMRNKLEEEIKKLHDLNRDLRDRLETASKQLAAKGAQPVDQRQHILVSLLQQNKGQQQEREQLQREAKEPRSSTQELRRQVEALEQALRVTQERCEGLEEQLRRRRACAEKEEWAQAACEEREGLEWRLRTQQRRPQGQAPPPSLEVNAAFVLQQLREREERILALEADVTKWEQKYLEESAVRHFAMQAAATAAAQRDTTLNCFPQFSPNNSFSGHPALTNGKQEETENRMRALYAELLEKDAVIRVLQHRLWRDALRAEAQGLCGSRSAPSISTAAEGTPSGESDAVLPDRDSAKSLLDDQAAVGSAPSWPAARSPGSESRNQSERPQQPPSATEPTMSSEPTTTHVSDVQENPQAHRNCYKITHNLEAELIEILI